MNYTEDICTYALSTIFTFDPRLSRAVITNLGSASAFFELSREERSEIFGPYSRFRDALQTVNLDKCASELEKACPEGTFYVGYSHPAFPEALAVCEDAPVGLFVRSADTPENIFGRSCIGIVGTRDATSYGVEWCQRITASLADSSQRPTVVSGLAYGIDITAHKKALETGLPTIAVLGTGIDTIYPVRHERIAERIMNTASSAVISEFPPAVDVMAINFLQRNRIIAGLCEATILVESKIKGGGMTTARIASSYGREVYAVPGRNDDLRSQGCNVLIQSHIAESLISCESFFDSRGYKVEEKAAKRKAPSCSDFYRGSMDNDKIGLSARMLSLVRARRGISISEIAEECRVALREVTALLYRLESDGFIKIDLLQRCSINA